ncbi:uncharacterized protein LOC143248908 [Tachypleus tridentatus]|uniref:uncharacterized protein LOC143248908 n=1 Tax=Tachypleus tridentatus TaxID=6853 RepID=UPI003FD3874A
MRIYTMTEVVNIDPNCLHSVLLSNEKRKSNMQCVVNINPLDPSEINSDLLATKVNVLKLDKTNKRHQENKELAVFEKREAISSLVGNELASEENTEASASELFYSDSDTKPRDVTLDRSTTKSDQSSQQLRPSVKLNDYPGYRIPIVGCEVMEERARFTVFRIKVENLRNGANWFVFRRYTDFARLNKKLKTLFQGLRLQLPSKRWFRDNFDTNFLEARQCGLQAFINDVISHQSLIKSKPVQEFFCLNDPPGPNDSLEESRAMYESLERTLYLLREKLKEKDIEIELLKAEVKRLHSHKKVLFKSLELECSIMTKSDQLSLQRVGPVTSSPKHSSPCALSIDPVSSIPVASDHFHRLHHLNMTLVKLYQKFHENQRDEGLVYNNQSDVLTETLPVLSNRRNTLPRSVLQPASASKFLSFESIPERCIGDGCTDPEMRLSPLGGSEDLSRLFEINKTKINIISTKCEADSTLDNFETHFIGNNKKT